MTIFENDFIKVSTTEKHSAFITIATIENKTDKQICVHYGSRHHHNTWR